MKEDQYSLLKEKIKSKDFNSVFVLVDENTDKHCLDIFINKSSIEEYNKIIIKAGEENKNINTCIQIWKELNLLKADRKSLLINLGGGVLTDIGGFVASTYLRGIKFINVPTTLLGMVDAAHGGKTGIDFLNLKNQIGVFSMPIDVILDSTYLKTLSKEEYLNGYAEVFKHSFLSDSEEISFNSLINLDFFNDVDFIIKKYSEVKNKIVKIDKYESDIRKVLNLGHTIGHALESYSHISNNIKTLKHGEAIIVGLITELYISAIQNNFPLITVDKLKEISSNYFEKINLSDDQLEQIFDLMIFDKKNENGMVYFVLLDKNGKPLTDQKVDKKVFVDAFDYYRN
tara:strand:- start:444 stop:1472 length:1029 start_codon:yes stop_codon:yes gene_type:complete